MSGVRSSVVAAISIGAAALASWSGCSSGAPAQPTFGYDGGDALSPEAGNDAGDTITALTPQAQRLYPNLDALYGGDQGIYRGCGPNNAVCHNSREFPNLATVGSIVEDIGQPCNEKRTKPTDLDDLCERPGDLLQMDSTGIQIAWIENVDPAFPSDDLSARLWRIVLQMPAPAITSQRVSVVRPPSSEIYAVTDYGAVVTNDPQDSRALLVQLPPPPDPDAGGQDAGPPVDYGAIVATWFAGAGVPGDPQQIQEGDANRNGTFGATLGGALIKPGAPDKSYVFSRLSKPDAGPLMPRANCCFWTKTALRAFWCWVAALSPDASNALDPIDYSKCPDGPPDTMVYPEPGPNCATSGLCPAQPKGVLTPDPTWANIYPNLIQVTCTSCHSGGASAAAGVDLGASDVGYQSLMTHKLVVPHDASSSILYKKIDPATCSGDCMPKGGQPLSAMARDLVKQWIDQGASP
jgi:hypothetical protein